MMIKQDRVQRIEKKNTFKSLLGGYMALCNRKESLKKVQNQY